MENLPFSEEEIRQHLQSLGFTNVAPDTLHQFKRDLHRLIQLDSTQSEGLDESESYMDYVYQDDAVSGNRSTAGLRASHAQVPHGGFRSHNCIFPGSSRHGDAYAQHTVAPKHGWHVPLSVDAENMEGSSSSEVNSPDSSKPIFRRKVARKCGGQSYVSDESSFRAGPTGRQQEQDRGDLSVCTRTKPQVTETTKSSESLLSIPLQSCDTGTYRIESQRQTYAKSFIRPQCEHRRNMKTDPVARYLQYKKEWELFKPPGEDERRMLRREIREQMMYKNQPHKPQRVIVPNTYVIPTEKKRLQLRWEVRHNLANGIVPT